MQEEREASVQLLKTFAPLDGLKRDNLAALAKKVSVRTMSAGRMLFKEGDTDKRTIWLVGGIRRLRRVSELRWCRGRGGRRGRTQGGRLAWLRPRSPVGDRGEGLLVSEGGYGRPRGGHLMRRRLMGTGKQPGARPQRDDPAAQDKEPPLLHKMGGS